MDILKELMHLEQEAAEFGFKWENTHQIMAQIQSECAEVHEHLDEGEQCDKAKLQEEIGDLLHTVFSLCVFCKFEPEETLRQSIKKFQNRFEAVKAFALKKGLENLKGQSFNELMELWEKAKRI